MEIYNFGGDVQLCPNWVFPRFLHPLMHMPSTSYDTLGCKNGDLGLMMCVGP